MKTRIPPILLGVLFNAWATLPTTSGAEDAQRTSNTDPTLQAYLKNYPESDTDRDGVLTWWEREQHVAEDALAEHFPTGTRHMQAAVPMRDGFKLNAEVFLPPEGEKFPVVVCRAGYGRWRGVGYGKRFIAEGIAFVSMDVRKFDKGAHPDFADPESSEIQIADTAATMDWLIAQPWCDGRIGTTGGSGNGFASTMGFWSLHPNHLFAGAGNTAGNLKYYWAFQNGVARKSHRWLTNNGMTPGPQRPTLPTGDYDYSAWVERIGELGPQAETIYSNGTGWFDPLLQGALDDFSALQESGKAFVRIEPRGHGGTTGFGEAKRFKYPENHPPVNPVAFPSMTAVLKEGPGEPPPATLSYFLMGDVKDPQAPGNQWVFTHVWPPKHTATPYYLHADGTLSLNKPAHQEALSFTYRPWDAAPSLGGHHSWSAEESGPHDQRPLRARDDVLYFVSAPLKEAVNVTGRISATLFVSSDAPDTLFVVKLVDIYPDGYEAILREAPAMARYAGGFKDPQPLTPGMVVKLDVDLWSTANVFNTGHRIGVLVTSSSYPAYEVHPNTFTPITLDRDWTSRPENRDQPEFMNPAYREQGREAVNTLHIATDYPSQVVLPVISEDSSVNTGSHSGFTLEKLAEVDAARDFASFGNLLKGAILIAQHPLDLLDPQSFEFLEGSTP